MTDTEEARYGWACTDPDCNVTDPGPYTGADADARRQAHEWVEHGRETQAMRDARFTARNDETWGEGNWVRCPTCSLDEDGFEVYHHRDAHR